MVMGNSKILHVFNFVILLKQQQVAQLCQLDCTKLDMFLINVQHYMQNHALNCIFGPPYPHHQQNVSFIHKTAN